MDLTKVTLLTAEDIGDDVVSISGTIDGVVDKILTGEIVDDVEATIEEPRVLYSTGWVSALKNMTKTKKQDYCKTQLIEKNLASDVKKIIDPPVDLNIVD